MAVSYVEADGEGAPAAAAEPVAGPVGVAADERGRRRARGRLGLCWTSWRRCKGCRSCRRRSTRTGIRTARWSSASKGKAQVEALYGHVAENMLSQPATKIFFKTSEPYASEWISKSIGEIEVERFRESRTRGAFPQQRENEQREITREPLVMASEIGGLEPLHGYLKHGNYVLRLRIPYLTLNEPAEKFIERKMTTPATATPATTPAKEPEPAQAITPPAPPPRKPVRAVQVEQGQEQRPAAVNEQTPFFE